MKHLSFIKESEEVQIVSSHFSKTLVNFFKKSCFYCFIYRQKLNYDSFYIKVNLNSLFIIKLTIGGEVKMTATTMNVNAVIDQAKFKPFHLTVVLWCLFVVLFDGYDLAINGVALPLLMKEWGMTAV